PHSPSGNFEKRKNLRRDLDQEPARDRVSKRDAKNFASFEFSEKRFHHIAPVAAHCICDKQARPSCESIRFMKIASHHAAKTSKPCWHPLIAGVAAFTTWGLVPVYWK